MVLLKSRLIKMNLFTREMKLSEQADAEKMAIVSSRVYAILLVLSILILILFNSLAMTTISATVQFPSITAYEDLQAEYPDSLSCPCKQIAVSYGAFLSVTVSYHQVKDVKVIL